MGSYTDASHMDGQQVMHHMDPNIVEVSLAEAGIDSNINVHHESQEMDNNLTGVTLNVDGYHCTDQPVVITQESQAMGQDVSGNAIPVEMLSGSDSIAIQQVSQSYDPNAHGHPQYVHIITAPDGSMNIQQDPHENPR